MRDKRVAQLFPDLLESAMEERPSGLLVPIQDKYGDDFDILALMNSAKDPDTGLMRDLKVDDGDLRHASSYYDYCFNVIKEDAHPPWMMQMWIGLMLFAEFCPVCSDKRWLSLDYMVNHVDRSLPSEGIQSHIKILKHGVCPKCKRTKYELIKKFGLVNYVELVNVLGQRSGKSASAAGYSSYITHRYLKFPKLATMTKAMQKSTELTGTFVSLTFAKALSLLWTPYINIINESSWFQEYHAILDDAGNRYGIELYRKKDEYIKYYLKGLRFYPTNPKSQTLRGDCLTGDTLINTGGGFVHFNELNFPNGLTETDQCVDTPLGKRRVSHTYKKVDREIIKITTKNGLVLKGTPEHRVLVITPSLDFKWRRMDSLVADDYIVSRTTKNTALFGKSLLSKSQATILGSFTANGFRHGISSDDPKVVQSFVQAVKGATNGVVLSKPSKDLARRASNHVVKGVTVNGRVISFPKVLEAWGYSNVLSAEKEIPFSVRTAPREILHEYLEAYFACDCGINGGATKKARARGVTTGVVVELSSASKKLIQQLQVILLQVYGIVGRKHKKTEFKSMTVNRYQPKKYVTWYLSLTSYDADLFLQTFKRAKVQKYAHRVKDNVPGVGSDRREIPYVRRWLNDLFKGAGKTHFYENTAGERTRKPSRPFFLWRTDSTAPVPEGLFYSLKTDLREFLSASPGGDKLLKVLALGAHYERVESVKRLPGTTTVYDITVPKGHAFTANGLSSHNTRILGVIDELGLFPLPTGNEEEDEKSDRANADEAHKSLSNSLTTVQSVHSELLKKGYNAPPAILMGVSSPTSMRDKVMRLLQDSRTDEGKKYILGVNLPTWQVNPFLDKDSPMIAKAYASNPEKAERDFGANPPRVSQTLIKPAQVPFSMFKHKNSHNLVYQYDQPGLLYAKVQKVYSPKYPSVVTIDAGHTNNSFALTAGHFDFDTQKTVISTVLEIMTHDKRNVDFNLTYLHLILPILKAVNAVLLLADQWQSLDILSRAREDMGYAPGSNKKHRCSVKQYSPKRKDFDSLVSMMDNGAMEFPLLPKADYDDVTTNYIDYRTLKDQPIKHLLLQMLTVKDVGPTKAPIKGEGFTDDMFRALVLTNKIHDEKVMERLKEARGWLLGEGGTNRMPDPVFMRRGGF